MNEHIENYCIDYIESEFNPQFAILIKGEWGCGKTYFINKLISRYKAKGQKIQTNEIIYVSLFGIGQISEINDRLFQKMHPVLSSEKFKFATGFINSALYGEYIKDKDNLVKLSKLYDASLGDIEYNPPELLKRDISDKLHKLVEYFNKHCDFSNQPIPCIFQSQSSTCP